MRTLEENLSAPTWCPSPWFEMYIEPNGDVHICCESDSYNEPSGNIHDNSMEEIFHSKTFRDARETMMADKWPRVCHYCKVKEEKFGASSRTGRLHGYKKLIEANSDNFTTMNPKNIFKLKIDFSNGCNLRCNMCSEHRSTAWIKDKNAMVKDFADLQNYDYGHHNSVLTKPKQLKKITSNIPREFVDDNLDFLLTLQHIEVSGGEPFFHPEFIYLLEKLKEAGWKNEMKVITNLTLLTPEIAELLSNFNTRLILSIDACGPLYEYIRPATVIGKYTWEDIEQNIELCIEKGFGLNFAYTVQIYNFYNLIEWTEFYTKVRERTRVPNMFNNNSLVNPQHLMICNHPDQQEKEKLAALLKKDDRVFPQVIESILATPDPKAWEAFCRWTDYTDKLRNTSIFKYIPEFEKYWI